MTENCVIVSFGFRRENLRLQPWRYVYELAIGLTKKFNVIIITTAYNGESRERLGNNLEVIYTSMLSVRRQGALASFINGLAPYRIWWSTSPCSIAYWFAWKIVVCPIICFITCPFYTRGQLLRALMCGIPMTELRSLLLHSLVPTRLFVKILSTNKVSRIITQSKANRNFLLSAGLHGEKVRVIPVGIDSESLHPVDEDVVRKARTTLNGHKGIQFLYFGAISPIRGVFSLIKAFAALRTCSADMFLVILARGENERKCNELYDLCKQLGIANRVCIIGGWLTRQEVFAYLEICDAVILPFVIVPSDVPITILEAVVKKKPIISSPVDGIPELVRGRGVIVDPLNIAAFSEVIASVADILVSNKIDEIITNTTAEYFRWEEIAEIALAIE